MTDEERYHVAAIKRRILASVDPALDDEQRAVLLVSIGTTDAPFLVRVLQQAQTDLLAVAQALGVRPEKQGDVQAILSEALYLRTEAETP